jgi:coniferyl-aldehyde dehydrogenase
MKAASENLVPVPLELGGQSPVIVAKGHVQDQTVSDIVFGRLLSGGQTCIAPDYALVLESDVDAFVASYDRLVKAAYPAGPTSKDDTSIVNDKKYQIVVDLIEDARAHGAQIIEVGHQPGDASRRPHTLAPARRARRHRRHADRPRGDLRLHPADLLLWRYQRRHRLRECTAQVTRAVLLRRQPRRPGKVLTRRTSGNVTIKGTIMHVGQDDLPFGGVGASGMGKYHGIEGFRTLSHPKGIFERGRWNSTRLVRDPFGRSADALLYFLIR